MIGVLFEVTPAAGQEQTYLDHAAALHPQLQTIPGFVSVERYRSLAEPHRLLSLSFFTDEAALAQWRALPAHRLAQAAGRAGVFSDYRLRIATVIRDYGLTDRAGAPHDSRQHHG